MKKIFSKIAEVLFLEQHYYICKYLNSKYLKDETNIKTIALAIVLIAGYNVYTSQQDVKMFSLTLANIEALAMDETSQCDNANGYRRILEEMNEYMIAAIWKKQEKEKRIAKDGE